MSSQAQTRFEQNLNDIERLLEVHRELTGDDVGRRSGVEVLNKSAVVLVCARWEAFVEDLCTEAADVIATRLSDHSRLPELLRKHISLSIANDKNELARWDLAGDGWRNQVKVRAKAEADKLNTPKSKNINDLFDTALGLENIIECWRWQKMSQERAVELLDEYVSIRGDIAHMNAGLRPIKKTDVSAFVKHTDHLVRVTAVRIDGFVSGILGEGLV